jgi:hypothetical protein
MEKTRPPRSDLLASIGSRPIASYEEFRAAIATISAKLQAINAQIAIIK